MAGQTPSQTVGPYFALGLTPRQYGYPFASIAGPDLTTTETSGARIALSGQVFDGDGAAITDAMVEIWQADAAGRYPGAGSNASFRGFGRSGTGYDASATYAFTTVRPGAPAAGQAPHINVAVFMRGTLNHLYTRIYFPDDAGAHDRDPVLAAVPPQRRATLISTADGDNAYRFDIHMQGPQETVFFDL